jgi:hypothetical protein
MADILREKGSTRPMILRPGKKKAEPYMRASEVAKLVQDTYGLNIWQQDRLAYVVATDEHYRALWAATDPEEKGQAFWDRKELRERTIRSYTAGKSYDRKAAAKGTRFHSITDKSDSGDLFDLDEDYADDLAVYQNVLSAVGEVVASERFVVNDELGIGGTFDKLIAPRIPDPDGNDRFPVIADLKTGKVDKKELEFGMQMAVYANSVFYTDGERENFLVNRKWAMIIHLPLGSNQATILWVDIAACFDVVKAAILIKEGRKPRVVSAMTIAGPTLEEKIASAPTKLVLKQLYHSNRAEWTDELTTLAQHRSDELG